MSDSVDTTADTTSSRERIKRALSHGKKGRINKDLSNKIMLGVFRAAAYITTLVLLAIIAYVVINGLPHISLDFIFGWPQGVNAEGGIWPTIVSTIYVTALAMLICTPVAVLAAVYLAEYAKQGKVVDIFMSPQHETTKALIGNVMARDMPASILDRFRKARENHPNSDAVYLLRLAFSGNEVTRPVISECSRRFNLDFNILRGTVDDVQGQTLGSLTVLIEAESSVFIEAVNFLRENGVVVEEINDVK